MDEEWEWDGTADEMIGHFEINAAILDAIGSDEGIDYAIAALATWLAIARPRLSLDELTLLTKIGGTLFRIGNKNMQTD